MKVVMIHEVTKEILEKDLSDIDIITFDDGLYSQFINISHFKKFKKPVVFFISTGIICDEGTEQDKTIISCSEAHKKAFNNNFENYMKWSQIKELVSIYGCEIGGHGHSHKVLSALKENIEDIANMYSEFKKHEINITKFCFPYNLRTINQTVAVQSKYNQNITFYGRERISVENTDDVGALNVK